MMSSVDNKEHNQEQAAQINDVEENIAVEAASENNETVERASEDESLTFEEKLEKNELKTIVVEGFSDKLKAEVSYVFHELEELAKEVIEKRGQALDKSAFIKGKVDALVTSGKVQIDKDEYEKSEASVQKYADLLENIVYEVNNELSYFGQFLNDELPETVIVPKWETDVFLDHITKKLRGVKKYVKDMKKDLNISYSRYCFGFEAQIRRIIYIESYLSTLAQIHKHDKYEKKETEKQQETSV